MNDIEVIKDSLIKLPVEKESFALAEKALALADKFDHKRKQLKKKLSKGGGGGIYLFYLDNDKLKFLRFRKKNRRTSKLSQN